MIFEAPPRFRRRALARLLWPVLLVAGVTIALIVSASGAETRAEIEFLSNVQSQATEIGRAGSALRDVIGRLQRTSRTEFVTVIEGMREDLAIGLEFTGGEAPTPSVLPVRALYREALESWESGIVGFSTAVLGGADDPDDASVVDALAAALADLRSGDAIYADMVAALDRDDIPEPLAPMPQVMLMPAEGGLVVLAATYIDSARSPNNTLALRPGLAISQIVTEPEWEVDAEDQVAMPATESVVFSVVVTNVGNVISPPQDLVLELLGGAEQIRANLEVEPLQPNQQVTMIFEAMPVTPGEIFEVRAALVVTTPDYSVDDNELAVQFEVNEG